MGKKQDTANLTRMEQRLIRDNKRLWVCLRKILGPRYLDPVTHARAADEAHVNDLDGLERALYHVRENR